MKDFFRVMFAPDDGGASVIVGTNDETVINPTIEERERKQFLLKRIYKNNRLEEQQ